MKYYSHDTLASRVLLQRTRERAFAKEQSHHPYGLGIMPILPLHNPHSYHVAHSIR